MPKQKSNKDDAIVKKLETKIRKLEMEKRRLQSENKTLKDALQLNEEYLAALAEDQTFEEIKEQIESKTSLTKIEKACPNCGNRKLQKRQYDGFCIESCSQKDCGYRNRANEGRLRKT